MPCSLIRMLIAEVCSACENPESRTVFVGFSTCMWFFYIKLINKLMIHMNSVCSGTLGARGEGSITLYFIHINHKPSQQPEKPVVPAVESHRLHWFQKRPTSPEGNAATEGLPQHMAPAEAEPQLILFVLRLSWESDHFQKKIGSQHSFLQNLLF